MRKIASLRAAVFSSLALILLVATACNGVLTASVQPATTPSSEPTLPQGGAATGVASPTQVTIPTAAEPSPTSAATTAMPTTAPTLPTPAATTQPGANPLGNYLDDRSDPFALMRSYVNSINLKQYTRAYSYWEQNAMGLAPYSQFEAGFAHTKSVQLFIGKVTSDAGAGNFYYSVPVVLVAQTDTGTQTFTGTYTLHTANPGVFGAPPFRGLGIRSATVQQVANGSDPATLLGGITPQPGGPVPTPAASSPDDVASPRFIDDRSDGAEVVRSYFNAINRHEYVRAYSYWEAAAAASQLPPYDQFEKGYENTDSVQLTTGQVTNGFGAGQIYYQVPVALVSKETDGTTQTFVGCYTLHIGRPENQTAPPFQPLSISGAKINQVANGTNTTPMLATICQ